MKRITLADGITWFFILFFFYAGFMKLIDTAIFRQQLVAWPFIGSAADLLAKILPGLTILLAATLIMTKTRQNALYATSVLIALFTLYDCSVLITDYHIVSISGGLLDGLSPRQNALFNSACLVLCGIAILPGQKWRVQPQLTKPIAIISLVVIAWLSFSSFTAPRPHQSGFEGRLLPSIDLVLPDSITHLNTEAISKGQPIIVIGFAPFCKYCQAQTRDILEHAFLFKDTRILYITPEPYKSMKTFYRHYDLQKYPNIIMGRDSANIYFRYFNATGTPWIAIYDGQKRLKKIIPGQDSATTLAHIATD